MTSRFKLFIKLITPMRYYEIIGGYTGKVIGHCTSEGIEDVRSEEPRASFRRISKKQFYSDIYK